MKKNKNFIILYKTMENLQNVGIDQFASMQQMPKTAMLEPNVLNEPNNLTWWQLIGKTFTGLVVWGIISALVFVVLTFIGWMFVSALGDQAATGLAGKSNPLLPLILLFIGFISTFIGNLWVAGLYGLFYSKKYVDTAKKFGVLLLTNGLLFFILAPIYLVFSRNIETLFIILGFHVLFSVFISACQTEFTTNPNYAGSTFMGNIIGFAGALLVYALIYKSATTWWDSQQQTYLLMLLPAILWYTIIPLGAGIRDKIYYKLYEMGNNAFYVPSASDTGEDMDDEIRKNESEDINIDA